MQIARRLIVRGRVQGVGFRAFVERAARREGLAGWVGNREDGAVELRVEGEAGAVAVLEQTARVGPSGAWVSEVVVVNEPVLGLEPGFRVTMDPSLER